MNSVLIVRGSRVGTSLTPPGAGGRFSTDLWESLGGG